MPRPWDYTPFRRRLMQAVLCSVLGLSIALAWMVVRQHRKAMTPSQWQTRAFEAFNVKVPAGWKVSVVRMRGFGGTRLDETKPYMGVSRTLLLEQNRTRGSGMSAEDFAAQRVDDRVTPEMCQPLEILGQKGVLVQVPSEPQEEDGAVHMLAPRLFAVAVLPTRLAIVVELAGPIHFTAADAELLRTVATSLKEAV